jgi:CubicO group peptidase (beta-lactamase class C family)
VGGPDHHPHDPREETKPEKFRDRPLGAGYPWWVWDDPDGNGPPEGAFTYIGDYGQYLTVIPGLDMAVAHQVQAGGFAPDDIVSWKEYEELLWLFGAAIWEPETA